MNETAFTVALVVTLGYYFYTVSKARKEHRQKISHKLLRSSK